jgi:hypothetical protein
MPPLNGSPPPDSSPTRTSNGTPLNILQHRNKTARLMHWWKKIFLELAPPGKWTPPSCEANRNARQRAISSPHRSNLFKYDNDVRSFGSIFGRTPDDSSIATTPDGLSTAENTPGQTHVVVQFDKGLPSPADTPMTHDDRSFDASSAGFTTGSTRSKLREQNKSTTPSDNK